MLTTDDLLELAPERQLEGDITVSDLMELWEIKDKGSCLRHARKVLKDKGYEEIKNVILADLKATGIVFRPKEK